MYKKFLVVFLVYLFFASDAVYSQKNGVELLCSPRKDSVLLRWAPTNQKVWKVGNQYGYTVLRYPATARVLSYGSVEEEIK